MCWPPSTSVWPATTADSSSPRPQPPLGFSSPGRGPIGGQPAVYLYITALEENVLNCRCDTRSHFASELADWRADDVGRVVRGACSRPAPPCRAPLVTA